MAEPLEINGGGQHVAPPQGQVFYQLQKSGINDGSGGISHLHYHYHHQHYQHDMTLLDCSYQRNQQIFAATLKKHTLPIHQTILFRRAKEYKYRAG